MFIFLAPRYVFDQSTFDIQALVYTILPRGGSGQRGYDGVPDKIDILLRSTVSWLIEHKMIFYRQGCGSVQLRYARGTKGDYSICFYSMRRRESEQTMGPVKVSASPSSQVFN